MEQNNKQNKKIMLTIIGVAILVIGLVGVTYAFFNYTRTGSANVIKTGKISFNSEQGTAINLTNMFPIDVTSGIPNDNTKVGTVTLNVTGDTTYDEGIEYLVSAVNVQNTVGSGQNAKTLPISIDVSVTNNTTNDPATTLGTADSDYFDNRGGNSSIYKVLANDTISTNGELLVGYITKGATGVDANIVIKAYLDASKILISDTYNNGETPTDNLGTPASLGEGKTVFTTQEWNSLQANGVSFQVRVEANEGVWVEEPVVSGTIASCPGCKYMYPFPTYNYGDNGTLLVDLVPASYFQDGDWELYYDDYNDVVQEFNDNAFIGFTESNGRIDKVYACGLNNGTPYCIEGSNNGNLFASNKTLLQTAWNNTCTGWDSEDTDFSIGIVCGENNYSNGDVEFSAAYDGSVSVGTCWVDGNEFSCR